MFAVNRWVFRLVVPLLVAALGVLALSSGAQAAGESEIEARWMALGGASGVLGPKLPPPDDVPHDVTGVAGARAQDFANGSILWSQATGAWEVRGAILDAYLAAGGPAGTLGLPTAAPAPVTTASGESQVFTGGHIYWSAATGAHRLQGPVLAKYVALGGPDSTLGLPRSGETSVPGGTRTVFQGGHIYRSTTGGARVVAGAILSRFLAQGGSSVLGMPTTDEVAAAPGGRVTVFTRGRIYWSAATGARAIKGAILSRYLAAGGPGSYLGFPETSEYAVKNGRRNRFVNGWITYYWGKGPVVVGAWRPAVQRVKAAEIPYTYRSGCPVGPASLRRVKMPYYNWSGVPRWGDLIVRTSAADDMQRVFKRAFSARFNIRQIRPVDVWRGSDIASMKADNTSAFNCRKVTGNPYRLSQHSYGNAIDINTAENPYVTSSRVYPAGSRTYLNRRNVRRGMIVASGPIARAMRAEGWPWGARWSHPDYQHFSSNGG